MRAVGLAGAARQRGGRLQDPIADVELRATEVLDSQRRAPESRVIVRLASSPLA